MDQQKQQCNVQVTITSYHFFLPSYYQHPFKTNSDEIYCLSHAFNYLYFLSTKFIIKAGEHLMQLKTFMTWYNITSSPTVLQILYLAEVFNWVVCLNLPLLVFQSSSPFFKTISRYWYFYRWNFIFSSKQKKKIPCYHIAAPYACNLHQLSIILFKQRLSLSFSLLAWGCIIFLPVQLILFVFWEKRWSGLSNLMFVHYIIPEPPV